MSIGVYMIKNIINSKYYIGSSCDLNKRCICHFSYLRRNKHHSKKFQQSFNKYGESAFIFGVLEYCEEFELQTLEQLYLDTYFNKNCLNIFKDAYSISKENHPMYGKNHTPEAKLKIKEARIKQIIKHSQETKDKISYSNLGKKVSMDHINKMIDARKNKPVWNKGQKGIVKYKYKIKLEKNSIDLILKNYQNGSSIESIRKDLKLSWDTIKRILIENNINTRNISQQKIYNYECSVK